jgi:hypothetical protein
MISTTSVDNLRIYSQNVGKKHNWTISLLEQMKLDFDILFLQEPPWGDCTVHRLSDQKGQDPHKGTPNPSQLDSHVP